MSGTPGAPTMGAAILSGGRASRYGGSPKGLLEIGPGVSIMGNQIKHLRASGLAEMVIVANDAGPYRHLGLPLISDLRSDCGPLGGVEAALTYYATRCDAVLLLPCDLPGITAREITRLREASIASGAPLVTCVTESSSVQPLCAIVHRGVLPAVSAALDAGRLSVRRLWHQLGALEVPFVDATPFFNVNSPEDLTTWLTRSDHRGATGPECSGEHA